MLVDQLASSGTRHVIAGVAVILVVASIICESMWRVRREEKWHQLVLRVRSWWLICAVFFGCLFAGSAAFVTLFFFVSFLALKEFFSNYLIRRTDRRVLFWAYLSLPVQYYWIYSQHFGWFTAWIPVAMFLILPLRAVLSGNVQGFTNAMGSMQWGLMLTVFSLSHVAALYVFSAQLGNHSGLHNVLFLVILTQLGDVFAFLWGKALGGPKIIPKVSPNKTWSGALGGVLSTSVVAALLGSSLCGYSYSFAFLAGMLIAVCGFIGDVVISAFKRDVGVKDSGSLLPGHGGILDRVDSLTYSAPMFFYLLYLLKP